jgi:hypothetical protein
LIHNTAASLVVFASVDLVPIDPAELVCYNTATRSLLSHIWNGLPVSLEFGFLSRQTYYLFHFVSFFTLTAVGLVS